MAAPALERHCNSWIAVCRSTGAPVLETFSRPVADAIDAGRFEVLTAAQWLARFNAGIAKGAAQ